MYVLIDRLLDILLSPALWLSVLLALVYSGLFTAWRGGGLRQFPKDLLAGLAGFAAGQFLSTVVHLDLLRVGEVRLLGATMGAGIGLLVGRAATRRLKAMAVRSRTAVRRTPTRG